MENDVAAVFSERLNWLSEFGERTPGLCPDASVRRVSENTAEELVGPWNPATNSNGTSPNLDDSET
jgi:hypothetical protein